ncbi:hypothetical protein ECC02_011125 [Trypanosoma cruzi]|uniref:Nucleolar RNA helicase II n=1 Tax=Trypanosoma cruzi TaxID=5693 RepID=A0A7J6XPH4_TRYCR|nr:hypothetical protein ECC02_011125 [Trypanosoma cruzi]
MQYIQWAHYVCASWDEVRARVHAREHTQRLSERRVCVRAVHGSLPHSHAATTAAAAAHATTTRRSKRGEVVWEAAVLPSLSPVVAVVFFVAVASTGVSFGLDSLFSFCFSSAVPAPSAAGSLLGMRSSVLLSALLLAASPFAVGDGGLDSALSSWTRCGACTGGKSSVLDGPFIVAGGGDGVAVCIPASLAGIPRVSVGAS